LILFAIVFVVKKISLQKKMPPDQSNR